MRKISKFNPDSASQEEKSSNNLIIVKRKFITIENSLKTVTK